MHIVKKEKGKNIAIFTLQGRLDSDTSPEVERKIVDSIDLGRNEVILDCAELDYISSAGIRVLVHCLKRVERLQGEVCLVAIPKEIEDILYTTGFMPYFKIFEKENDAVEAISKRE